MTEYKRIFIDTAPIIYYLQHNDMYFDVVKKFFLQIRKEGASFVLSDITTEEYCTYPYRVKNDELIKKYYRFIELSQAEVIHTSDAISRKAAKIRAEYTSFKSMDAFQLAFAVESKCDEFLTNDRQLLQFTDIKCLMVDEL